MTHLKLTIFLIAGAFLFASCSDDSTGPKPGPDTGNLTVTTNTTGEDQDTDGYTVTVDGEDNDIDANGSATIENLDAGSYDVELSDINSNCSLSGESPRSVDILAGETVSTSFQVSCQAMQGQPMISAVNPQTGPAGTSVTIRGMNFSSTASENTVTFGDTEANVSRATAKRLFTEVPDGLADSSIAITVTVGGETTEGPNFTVDAQATPPQVDDIAPEQGPPGTELTITGSGFGTEGGTGTRFPHDVLSQTDDENSGVEVTIGGQVAPLGEVTSTTIIAYVPDGATGDEVVITVGEESAESESDFTTEESAPPEITSVSPASGAAGAEVTIKGSNFSASPVQDSVFFGSTQASLKSASTDKLVAIVPDGASLGDAEVRVDLFGNTAKAPNKFTVERPAPTINSLNPSEGPVTTEVTIKGSDFSPTTSENTVTFAGTKADVVKAAEDQLVTKVPEGAGDGPVKVTVTNKTGTGPDFDVLPPGTATVENPSVGARLEDEITFAVSGQAVDGYEEVRLFVDNKQIKTIKNPGLPLKQTIQTHNYNNGNRELRAELDPAGFDTTIVASVNVTFENYFLEFNTSNYINNLQRQTDATYMFIADPAGNVLREIELTAQSDGNLQLLPPSAFDGQAPERFSITIGVQGTNYNGDQEFMLTTDVGFPAWSDIVRTGFMASNPNPRSASLPVTYGNSPFDRDAGDIYGIAQEPNGGAFFTFEETLDLHITPSAEELMLSQYPPQRNQPPLFRLEGHVQDSLNGPGSLRYNVAEDFEEMSIQDVGTSILNAPNLEAASVKSFVSTNAGFNQSIYAFFGLSYPNGEDLGDGNIPVAVPDIADRTVGYEIQVPTQDGVYLERIGNQQSLPGEFSPLDATVEGSNTNVDNLQFSISGSPDYIELRNRGAIADYSRITSWSVNLPNTATSFVYPFIEDSLDASVTVYNRSDFDRGQIQAIANNYDGWDSYTDFINAKYGQTSLSFPFNYQAHSTSFVNSSSGSRVPSFNEQLRRKGERQGTVEIKMKDGIPVNIQRR